MKKVALITGGTRGIGLGIARQLLTDGFALAINGRRPLTAVQSTLTALGDDCLYCQE